jgi:hypothetical protein
VSSQQTRVSKAIGSCLEVARVRCPSVASLVNRSTTHLLHRPCRVVAGRSRSQPVRSTRKCLLQPVIPGRSRLYRSRPYRPVTPEVAGSSPVAPIKLPANRDVVLSVQTPSTRTGWRVAFGRAHLRDVDRRNGGRGGERGALPRAWPRLRVLLAVPRPAPARLGTAQAALKECRVHCAGG